MKNHRPIKTLQEIKEQEEKNWNSLKRWGTFLVFVLIICLLFLATMLCGCTSQHTHAAEKYSARENVINEKVDWQERVIVAYGDLLHEMWIDRPTYVEECLTEGDTFQKLSDLFGSDFGDIFTFWSIEDSIQYSQNWDNELQIVKVKRITLPEYGKE